MLLQAYTHGTPSVISPFLYSQIGFAMGVGWLLFGQVPDAQSLLGMAGVIIIQLKGGTIDSNFSLIGDGFLFLVCIASALGAVMTRVFTKRSDAMILTAYQLMIGGVVLMVVGLTMGGAISQITIPGLLLLGYLATLSAVAFTIWAILLKHNPVGIVSIYGFMIPVFGVMLSGLFLGEAFLNLRILVSLACVSVGIWLVNREAGQ